MALARYRHIDFTPPKGAQDEAQQGLDYRREYGRGGTRVGVARARDIANRRELSPETIRRMVAFFARHAKNRDPDASQPDGGPSNGWIAWLLWGGDAGRRWAEKVAAQMDAADQKENAVDDRALTWALAEDDMLTGVQIFAWGEVAHPNGDFEVTREFAREMLSSFEAMLGLGYYPPVLIEHQPGGGALGLVRRLYTQADGIYADLELADGVLEEVNRGRRPYISPSFYEEFEHPNTGEVLRFALREISFVSVPHLKNLRPLGRHYALSESGYVTDPHATGDPMADDKQSPEQGQTNLAEGEEMDMASRVEAMEKSLASLMEQLKPMMEYVKQEMMEDEEEEPEDMRESGDKEMADEAVATLTRRVADLERQLAEAEVRVQLGEDADDDDVRELAELHQLNPRLAAKAIARLAAAAVSETPEVGSPTAPASAHTRSKLAELCEQAREKGYTLGSKPYFDLLEGQGIDLTEYDHEVARKVYQL